MKNYNTFQGVVLSGDFVVLDTETTGLQRGEICQIAVIDSEGTTLIDSLVKTHDAIPADAYRIHGISDRDVMDAPTFPELLPELRPLLTDTNVLVYNAVYDRKMLHQSAERWGIEKTDWKVLSPWWCAMAAFAPIFGEWNSYRGSYTWKSLSTAAEFYNVPVSNAHNALGDCLMTLAVVNRIARS